MWPKKIVCLLLLTSVLAAQQQSKSLNVYGSMGFGIANGGQLFSSNKIKGNDTLEEEDSYFNYGRGLKFDFGIQYFLMDNIALQTGLGISANIPRLKVFNEADETKSNTTYRSSLWGFKALVVPHFEILELLTMYTGVGLGFFWNTCKYENKTEISSTQGNISENTEGKIKTSPKLAFLGLAGLNYPLSEKINLYGEVAFEQMSFTTKKRIEGNKTTVYEKDSNLEAPQKIPGSNWQLRFGVRFNVI